MLRRLEKFLVQPVPHGKAYLFLLLISALFIAPILFAGVDYIDDTSRKLEGSYQWGSLGRIATEGLMHVLTFNFGTMTDPGNLMQILCIPLLALTAFLIAKLFGDKGKISILSLIIGLQVIPNQLLLANLSFRFDSISMILGNLVAVFAAYVLLSMVKRRRLAFIISTLLIVVAAGLYQSTILMFGVVVVAVLVARYADRSYKQISSDFLRAVGAFVAGILAYGILIKLFQFTSLIGDRQNLVQFNGAGAEMAFANLKSGLKVVATFISNGEAFLLATLIAGIIGIGIALTIYTAARKRTIIETLIVGSSPIIAVLLIMGPFILLQEAQLTTQVRVLTAVIGIMLLAAAAIFALYKTGRRWSLWLLAVPLLMNMYSMGFAYTYGATLKAQRVTDQTVYESIVATVQAHPELQTGTLFIGGPPVSPWTVQTQFDKRPGLTRMDIAGDNSRWYLWNRLKDERVGEKVEIYAGRHGSKAAVEAICSTRPATPLLGNEFYTIYKSWEGVHVIWLKNHLTSGDLCTQI